MYGIFSHPSERKFLYLKDKYSPCLLVYLKNRHLTLTKLLKKRLSVDRFDGKVEISHNRENSKKFPHFHAPERILCLNFFFQIYHPCGSTFLLIFRVFLFLFFYRVQPLLVLCVFMHYKDQLLQFRNGHRHGFH